MRTSSASAGSRSRGGIRPGGIRGELLTTKRLLTRKLRPELLYGHLDDRHFAFGQFVKELHAAQSSELGALALRDEAFRIPFNGRRSPYVARDLLGALAESRKNVLGKRHFDSCHDDESDLLSTGFYISRAWHARIAPGGWSYNPPVPNV